MGLLDVLNGMQNGPRGEKQPGSGGMSPLTMALLGLLAYKAVKHLTASSQPGAAPAAPAGGGNAQAAPPAGGGGLGNMLNNLGGGGLGGLLGGSLGGLLAGGAAGSVLSGGLNDLLKQLQDAGHGDTAQSWVGHGDNKDISPNDLGNALGADTVNTLAQHTGLSADELLQGLAQQLPGVVDKLTPDGRVPTEHEMSRLV